MRDTEMPCEPDFDYPTTDGKSYVCVEEGLYHAYLDRDAAITLLSNLHWLADQPGAEEASISSGQWPGIPPKGKPIGYCEFNSVPSHIQKKQGKNILKNAQPPVRHKPHGIYSPENDRLDYFLSPEEARATSEALTLLVNNSAGKRSPQEARVLGNLIVHLVLP